MEAFMQKHARLCGAMFVLAGIGMAVWLKRVYDTGTDTTEDFIIGVPVPLLYGVAVMIEPRLMLSKGEFASAPTWVKVTLGLIVITGVGLGVLLRYSVFGAWQSPV